MTTPLEILGEAPPTLRRYRVEAGRTRVDELPLRAPAAAEVVVRVVGSALGAAPGAEVAGEVVATGPAAAEWLGRRVVVPRLLPCGECPRCRRGRVASCAAAATRGGVATHETVPARFLLSVEPPLWPPAGDAAGGGSDRARLARLAALADAAATPYGAIARAQIAPAEACVVVGAGVRGRLAAAVLVARGAAVTLVDGDAARVERARTPEIHRLAPEPPAALRARIAGRAAAAGTPLGELKVIETSGTLAGRALALGLLAEGGVGVLLGDGDGAALPCRVDELAAAEAVLVAGGPCHPDLYPELMALVVRGELLLASEVVLHAFEELADVVEALRAGRTLALPVLCPPDALA